MDDPQGAGDIGVDHPGPLVDATVLQRVRQHHTRVVHHPAWAAVAAETVAYLRLDAGRHPNDPAVSSLVGELSAKSEDFRRLWADHPGKEKTHGVKRLVHAAVGELEFGYETLALPGDPDQLLVAYTVPPSSATADRPALLVRRMAGAGAG
ncbi:hypothetical protein [Streptomyces sp. NPDC015350]|uniref:MmyB family transcriptional regulator n=1 Tax=Streptomyces sp. NPDC015350 TaxID=3364955 RepID=UPI003702963A